MADQPHDQEEDYEEKPTTLYQGGAFRYEIDGPEFEGREERTQQLGLEEIELATARGQAPESGPPPDPPTVAYTPEQEHPTAIAQPRPSVESYPDELLPPPVSAPRMLKDTGVSSSSVRVNTTLRPKLAPLRIGVVAFNLAIAIGCLVASYLIWSATDGVIGSFKAAKKQSKECKVIVADKVPVLEKDPRIPMQDRVDPEKAYIGARGTQRNDMMDVMLERVVGEGIVNVRFGSRKVLAPNKIYVLNLWGPNCGPCKDELPDFNNMFKRNAANWKDDVQFVPIEVLDDTPPATAYKLFGGDMPETDIKLADRSLKNNLTTLLKEATPERDALYNGMIPVTLVLDCNRRVRWGHYKSLKPSEFDDLENYVNMFVDELRDTEPGSWCQEQYCGNGRCEQNERESDDYCAIDCGPRRRSRPAETKAAVEESAPEPKKKAWALKGEDKKVKKKKPEEPAKTQKVGCGDGVCGDGENQANCCQDCPCSGNYTCKEDRGGQHKCLIDLK